MGLTESRAEALKRIRRSLRRVTNADFLQDEATEGERAHLARAAQPVTTRMAQDYASWRRPILWMAGAATLANLCFELFGYDALAVTLPRNMLVLIGVRNATMLEWLSRTPMLVGFVGSLMVLSAAIGWRRLRLSMHLARYGWLLMFTMPFLMATLPYARLLDLEHLDPTMRETVRSAIGAGFALSIFISVGPRTIALFPGIIRSSLALKTMLPEAPLPGWTVVLVGPLYSVFLLVFISGLIQAQGSCFLLSGAACLTLSPLLYVFRRNRLIRPQTVADAATLVRTVKREGRIVGLVGVTLLMVFILQGPSVGLVQVLGFLTGIIGNVVLLTVVGADFMLGVLRVSHLQHKEFQGSQFQVSLDAKLDAMEALDGPPVRPKP